VPQSAALIDHLVRDHEQIRKAMAELKTGAGLAKSIFDLGDLLERHIRREERELFPLFEQQVSASQAELIGEELKKSLAAKNEN
jgi:hemerythrin-like domain-containing protein